MVPTFAKNFLKVQLSRNFAKQIEQNLAFQLFVALF